MSALREITQIIDLFRVIAHIVKTAHDQDDLSEIRGTVQDLAEIGIGISQSVADRIDPFNGTQTAPTEIDTQASYEAVRAWYIDLNARIKAANGYFIPSGLRTAFRALPRGQQDAFLDGIGTLFTTWEICGGAPSEALDFAESLALDAMTPEQQDALSDQNRAISEAGNV